MEVSSPRQALGKIGELFRQAPTMDTASTLNHISSLVDAGLLAPQSCPADLLDEAAAALTSLLKSDRNHSVTHTFAVESKARIALARILDSPPPVAPAPAPMMPFAAPKDAAERWNIVRNISFGNFGGTDSQRLKAIHALAVGSGSDVPVPAPVPEVILVAANHHLQNPDTRISRREREELAAALLTYAPPKPPTTEELATALRSLASPGGVSTANLTAAHALLNRMPK